MIEPAFTFGPESETLLTPFKCRYHCRWCPEPCMQPVREEYQKQWSMDYQPEGYRQENDLFLNLSLFR